MLWRTTFAAVIGRMETNERQAGKPKRRAVPGQWAVIVDAPNPKA